jgi:uncharacterized protein YcfJ
MASHSNREKAMKARTATSNAIRTATVAALALMGATFSLQAADLTDTARVVSATPIIEKVADVSSDCGPSRGRRADSGRSMAAPIIGGIAGAILGNQVGKGNGNVAATAGGAIAGAVIGDRVGNRGSRDGYGDDPCRRVESSRDVVKGYNVVYRYNGRDVATVMPYDPGERVSVAISAIPDAPGSNAQGPYPQQGSYQPGPNDRGGYDRGAYDRGPNDRDAYDRGAYDRGPSDRGAYQPGPYDRGQYR